MNHKRVLETGNSCATFKDTAFNSQSRDKEPQSREVQMALSRGGRKMYQGPASIPTHSGLTYVGFICTSHTSDCCKNSTSFLLETCFFNAWWTDVKRHTRRKHLIPCGSRPLKRPPLFDSEASLQNAGFWESIESKSVRGRWGQGHCNTAWLGFS